MRAPASSRFSLAAACVEASLLSVFTCASRFIPGRLPRKAGEAAHATRARLERAATLLTLLVEGGDKSETAMS